MVKKILLLWCVTSLLLSGCGVSKKQYLELENTHFHLQKQLDQETRKLRDMELRLQNAEAREAECSKDLAHLRPRYEALENVNLNLSRDLDRLKVEMETSKSTIQHQKMIIRQLDDTKKNIETRLGKEIKAQKIKLETMEGKLKVTFVDKMLFNKGSVRLKERGQELLMEIGETLKDYKDQNILIEGHTDNIPIGDKLVETFPSNWELSSARASAVVRFLQEEAGLEPERLSACGYGFYRPLESNDTEEGRHQNRRIEIILTPPQ